MSLEDERRQLIERKRSLIYLIGQYLADSGLNNTRNTLIEEYRLTNEYQVCDNIDLDTIYMEFCSFYHLKFGKKPRIVKKMANDRNSSIFKPVTSKKERVTSKIQTEETVAGKPDLTGILLVSSTTNSTSDVVEQTVGTENEQHIRINSQRDFEHYSQDWKDIADVICRDLIKQSLNVKFSQIHGADLAKNILKESVILPMEHPELFTNGLQPWTCVLLHGPPGTGKTLIAKAICSETIGKVTFFNISSSSVISKWRGESEKFIRVLFELARLYAPSIIFIDEIESLTSKRDSAHEHESSKRFKNEFLTLIDGLNAQAGVFILCNSNLPWEIDPAFLRRFEQKILISPPNLENRMMMLKEFLPVTQSWPEANLHELAEMSDGFTGDELRIVCKEVSMIQIRKYVLNQMAKKNIPMPTVNFQELKATIESFRPTSDPLLQKHVDWNRKFGSYVGLF